MSVSASKIVRAANNKIFQLNKNAIDTARLAGVSRSLDDMSLYSVPDEASLPPAEDNVGRFIFVESIGAYRYSDGTTWVNDYSSVLRGSAGQIFSWGIGSFGRLGDGTTVNKCSPVREISSSTNWCQLTTKTTFSTAIKTDGTLWNWGYGACGQLGDGTTVDKCSPVREITSSLNWWKLDAGLYYTLAIKNDGTLWGWGSNICGRIGNGSVNPSCSPVREISSSTNWCEVTAGQFASAAIKSSGQLWAWGRGNFGLLGNGIGSTTVCSPVREISSSTNWCIVSIGNNNAAAIKTDGSLWSWGFNQYGILGDGTTVAKCSPSREISFSSNWCKVGVGGSASVSAIKTDGTIWSWGNGLCGRLGNGSVNPSCSPVREASSSTNWCDVSSGNSSSAGIKTDGTLWSWGLGTCGILGDGTTVAKCSPVREISSATDWWQVSVGQEHSTAIKVISNEGFVEI